MKNSVLKCCYIIILWVILLGGCSSIGNKVERGTLGPLLDVIVQSAEKIAEDLPNGSRVSIVEFKSLNDNLSEFIIEELTIALFEQGLEVADRQNLAYMYQELNFQMTGDVSDESARSIGKILDAQLVVTGQLEELGNTYRYRISTVNVEKAVTTNNTWDIPNDQEMRRTVTALSKQQSFTGTTKYGISENTTPQTAGNYIDRGMLFASRKEFELAIKDYTDALILNPNLIGTFYLRGYAIYLATYNMASESNTTEKTQAFERAISDLSNAIRLTNIPEAYGLRGIVYIETGDYDKAITDLTHAISQMSPTYLLYYTRGIAYYFKKDYNRAISDFTQTVRLNPNDSKAYYYRGEAYHYTGDNDRAIADYTHVIRLDPNSDRAYLNRGLAYISNKNYDKAIADLNQTIRLNPNSTYNAYFYRGRAYSQKGDDDRALADYSQVIRLNSNFADVYSYRGLIYAKKGDLDRAIADWENALRIEPGSAIVKEMIETARQMRGY